MKYLDEYRDASLVKKVIEEIHRIVTRPWVIMEICGGQTHSILNYGLDELMPAQVELVHGPGCPVCVTSLDKIDKAIAIASETGVIFTTFGDMLRVPGSNKDLNTVRSEGGQIRIVYSPLDAVRIAQENPDKQVVFFAIGFETTAPVNAMSVIQAKSLGLDNFTVLVSQVRVLPAIQSIVDSPNNRIQGFLAAGHVCAVMGYREYIPLATKYQVPIIIAGFEPLDLVQAILRTGIQLEKGTALVENAYSRAVTIQGNLTAQSLIKKVFEICDYNWRGIGNIPLSGLSLKAEYGDLDAEKRFRLQKISSRESTQCIAGEILQGIKKPPECPAFGIQCQPLNPLGAPMVSGEGACSAYYQNIPWRGS